VTQAVEQLLCKLKTLIQIPVPLKKKGKKGEIDGICKIL
jgi:hypothetical protein